jgi:hypothetical protein
MPSVAQGFLAQLVPPERPDRRADQRGGDVGNRPQALPGALVVEDAVLGGDLGGVLQRARRPLNQQPQFRTWARTIKMIKAGPNLGPDGGSS